VVLVVGRPAVYCCSGICHAEKKTKQTADASRELVKFSSVKLKGF
jgi:hypothetical protein